MQKNIRFIYLRLKRRSYLWAIRYRAKERQAHGTWSTQAAIREENPMWRRKFDGAPNPIYWEWYNLDPVTREEL